MLASKRRSLGFDNSASVAYVVESIRGMDLDSILKAKYRGFVLNFWKGLQTLHDVDESWNRRGARGMTDAGACYAISFALDHCPGSTGPHYAAAFEYLGRMAWYHKTGASREDLGDE